VREGVTAHYDALWRFLRRLGVPEPDVDDAAQRVLLVFAERIASVERGAERAFLLGTALRVASDTRRKSARAIEVHDGSSADDREAPGPTAEEEVDAKRLRRWLDEVLGEMPDDLRAALVLVDLEELTMIEAAVVLGIPQGTVASRLRRARELFEKVAGELKARMDGGAR
jgi:RNA polymerase sigma-70 factor, ECF subfamily